MRTLAAAIAGVGAVCVLIWIAHCVLMAGGPVWVRLELVENTAEGPATERCEVEANLSEGSPARWRILYGEAETDSAGGWQAIRSRSRCIQVGVEGGPGVWAMRGSPYLVVDVTLAPDAISDGEVRLELSLTTQKLVGFAGPATPTYERNSERRAVGVRTGGAAVIPVLMAGAKETAEFRVRELLLRVRAADLGARSAVEYGSIAVAADVPRASVFVDGGYVGRTTSEGSVTFDAVRTGEREVVAREAPLREARAVVKVEKGATAHVSLRLLPEVGVAHPLGLRPLGPNPQGSKEFWRASDEAVVVSIPAGELQMGSPEGEGEPPERPQHRVRVTTFFIDKAEVSWGQFRRFAGETGHPLPKPPIWGMPAAFPVSNVTWNDASAFCAWAGGRLPSEAEWERAARGDDARRYPWGDYWDPGRCNTRDGGPHAPTAVASYPDCISPYGVLDLAGSVSEWCNDWYAVDHYRASSAGDPSGPPSGLLRVVRGGAWMSAASMVRNAYRKGNEPTWSGPMHGFRCAQDGGEEDQG